MDKLQWIIEVNRWPVPGTIWQISPFNPGGDILLWYSSFMMRHAANICGIYLVLITVITIAYPTETLAAVVRDSTLNGTVTSPPSPVVDQASSVLMVSVKQGTNPSAITYNGDSLTNLFTHSNAGSYGVSVWYLLNPDIGTYTLVITGGTGATEVVSMVFEGADQSVPPYVSDPGSSTCVAEIATEVDGMLFVTWGADGSGGTPSGWTGYFNSNADQYQVGYTDTDAATTTVTNTGSPTACSLGATYLAADTGGDPDPDPGTASSTATTTVSIAEAGDIIFMLGWVVFFQAIMFLGFFFNSAKGIAYGVR